MRFYDVTSWSYVNLDDPVFQRFTLTDSFSDRELAPEWELDFVLQVQLAIFPANWNLVNSALPVNTYWVWFNARIAMRGHSLIDPSGSNLTHAHSNYLICMSYI